MAKSGVNVSFTYDVLGRQLTESGTLGTVTSAYDIAGRRTRITHPGGAFYVDQDYLVTGEMSKIRENGATSGVGVLATFGYDDQGRRTSLTRGNGTVTSYGYDPVSRLASLSENLAGTTHDQVLGFTYTPSSQIATNTRSNDLYAWAGHGSGTTNSTVNGLNQLTAQGGVSITHDARGNITGDGTRTYAYDSRNRLTSVTLGSATSSLVYDAAGRLNKLDAPYSRWYAYDGMNRILEGNGAATNPYDRRFVYGPGVDEPIVQYEGSDTSNRRFLHTDERGSLIAMSDSAGNVVNVNSYDEYGRPASTNTGRFQYTGQAWLPELGLYYYKNRFYHPQLTRFMQTDPIGFGGGMNIYAYVQGDPVNFRDPMGLVDDPNSCNVTGTAPCHSTGIDDLDGDGVPDEEIEVVGRRLEPFNWDDWALEGQKESISDLLSRNNGYQVEEEIVVTGTRLPPDEVVVVAQNASYPQPCSGEPGPCSDPFFVWRWYFERLDNGQQDMRRRAREYINNCVEHLDDVSIPVIVQGIAGGIVTGALKGYRTGPVGAARGGATGALGGALRSAIRQACGSGNPQ